MRILIIVPNMLIGGVQSFAFNLAITLSQNIENEVFLLSYSNELDPKYAQLLDSPINYITLNKKAGFSLAFLSRLYMMLRKINPDIINTHSSRSLRYLLVLPINHRWNIVHTITNNPVIYNKKLFPLYMRRMHQDSWHIRFVGISDIVSDTLSKVYKYKRSRIVTIYNGIPLLHNSCCEKKENDFFICAGLTDVKNHDLLIDALARANKVKPLSLTIAGNGPKKNEIECRIKENNLDHLVKMLGNVTSPDQFYYESRFFILTSRSEGNPLCIIEAMSAGLPIIAPRVGGIPDLVEDNVNGFLFDKDATADDVASLMIKCSNISEERYFEMSHNNSEKAQNWGIEIIAKKYLDLYKEEVRQQR